MSTAEKIMTARITSLEQIWAGKCTVTIEPPADWAKAHDRTHLTYRFTKSEDGNVVFVSILVGPQNTADYAYIGILPRTGGGFRWTSKSKLLETDLRVRIVQRVLAAISEGRLAQVTNAGWNLHSSGLCCRCGRKLTVPASVETGIGPECESLHRLGVSSWDEIPSRLSSPVARCQYEYWTTGDNTTLLGLHDAVLDTGKNEQYAEDLVGATRKAMRRFKGGKRLPADWIEFATW
jgi:hypothetical protein